VTRRRLLVAVPALLLVLALAGGLTFWLTRPDDSPAPQSQTQATEATEATATGVDAAPEHGDYGPPTSVLAMAEPGLSLDYLESMRQSLYSELVRQHEAETAAAFAAARAQDEAVAAQAIRAWGAGQLLLALPSIGVTAAVSQIGFEPGTRTPAIPYSAWGVGWYNFTDFPGVGGNAVFSGHVDYYTGEPAVFGRLSGVKLGDMIYVVLGDGTPIAYQVAQSYYVTPYTADVTEIFGITANDAITFVTCGGTWDAVAHDYSHRLIVRAMRVR
jgi:LPXTG-site transpeptidase (sortase) family protein